MNDQDKAQLGMQLITITEALGTVSDVVIAEAQAVARGEGPDRIELAQRMREVRQSLNTVQAAVLTVITEQEIAAMAEEDEDGPCGCMPTTVAQTPEARPPVEHGDEVAF